ncbi:Ent-kaurene oxidase [Choanephora cucurbitarum]|uniref:Ent-kaurene oxidase n=1 Tax=Choanephora cucurbitarum TaxID=101091 RepID=A0A1C7NRD2_9FUNG|nr:Ent-kaurene oxidase [Choanephora cucurbitarum]
MLTGAAKNTITTIANYWQDNSEWVAQNIPLTKKQCTSLSIAATITYITWKLYKSKTTDRYGSNASNLPPMVKGAMPIYGHLLELQKDPAKFVDEAKETYGPCFRISVPGLGTVAVVSELLISEVMKSGKNFSFNKGIEKVFPSEKIVELSYKHKYDAYKISTREKHPVIYPIKHNFKEHQIDLFTERIVKAFEVGLKKHLNLKKGEQKEIDVRPIISLIVADISCACFAGSQATKNDELIRSMAEFTTKLIKVSALWTLLPTWLGEIVVRRFYSVEREMDQIMNELVPHLRKVQNGEFGNDYEKTFATMVLEIPREDGSLRSPEDAAYRFNGIALASIHTTSHFTAFALHELAPRPELIQALRDELAPLGNDRTPETVSKLPLMESFFRELLRHNADYLGLHHVALQDTVLSSGHFIPKGTMVVLSVHQMHRNLRFLPVDETTGEPVAGDSPLDVFDAYRYYNKNVKSTTVGVEFLPFGMGAHACPGRFFAANEIKYIIAEIICRFNIKTKTGHRAKDNIFIGMTRFPPSEKLIFEAI